jgi:hypothetical protein
MAAAIVSNRASGTSVSASMKDQEIAGGRRRAGVTHGGFVVLPLGDHTGAECLGDSLRAVTAVGVDDDYL